MFTRFSDHCSFIVIWVILFIVLIVLLNGYVRKKIQTHFGDLWCQISSAIAGKFSWFVYWWILNQICFYLGDEFETVKITLGGDQLVRVRMSGAKDLLAGAHTAAERMEIFDPVVEELFHVEQDYLEVSSTVV